MEEQRQEDLRVPIIFAIFCIFVLAGGVFLTLYVFAPDSSAPWYPMAALVLIGSPWIFWFMTYIYTFIKSCYRRVNPNINNRQISKRSMTGRAVSTNSAMNRTASVSIKAQEPSMRDGNDAPQEVVVQGDQNLSQNGGASKEIEMT